MNFIEENISEQGIIDYIDDYQDNNHPDEIFKNLMKNLTIDRLLMKKHKKIEYTLIWDSYKIDITGQYSILYEKLMKFQVLYDFLFMWASVKQSESPVDMDEISLQVYRFFEEVFNKEMGLTEEEKGFLIEKVEKYYF